MDRQEYEAWKAREADYRAQRRKRKNKIVGRVPYLWDASGPPIPFENLVPRWQHALQKFIRALDKGVEIEAAWAHAAPSHHVVPLDRLDPQFRASVREIAERYDEGQP